MINVIAVAAVVVVALAIACGVSSPASGRTRSRDTARRASYVARHPQHVNSGDIERLLHAASLSDAEARLVTSTAAARGIKPFTMWMWIQQYDAKTLSVVVAADLTHQDLLTHLGNGTVPDLDDLKLFASLNGLSVTEAKLKVPVTAQVVRSAGVQQHRLTAERPSAMPPIFEPGSWPYTEWASDELPSMPDALGFPLEQDGSGDIAA